MTDVSVPWGSQELSFSLPENWELLQNAQSSLRPAPDDWPDRMALLLGESSTGVSLERLLSARRGGRICILLEDTSRTSPLPEILAIVLRELRHARVEDSRIELFFATGMHPPMTPQQVRDKVGPDAAALAWRCNPWHDKNAYVRVGQVQGLDIDIDRGVASADLRIIVSSVSPHLQAGFGGGYKMYVPGCAPRPTIRRLHRLGIGRHAMQLTGIDASKNQMRQVIDAAGELIDATGKSFAVQYLLDERSLPTAIATGDVLPSQQMLAKQAAVSCGVVVPTMGDVVIANAHPRDFDLWQSFKGIANTLWAARPGGVVICLTRCLGGLNGVEPISLPISQAWMRRLLRTMGPENLAGLVMRLVPRLAGDAAFFVRLALQALHRNWLFMVSPEMVRQNIRFPGLRLFADVPEALSAAGEILGPGRQRVIVFPSGGIAYPVPARPEGRNTVE